MLSNGALKFSRVTLGDAGTYQCLAKNEAGVAVGRTKLVLQGDIDLGFFTHQQLNICNNEIWSCHNGKCKACARTMILQLAIPNSPEPVLDI